MPLSIAIVGGGIGGLCLAHGLMRDARRTGVDRGLRVQVYERDASATSRGHGYLLGLNADGVRSLRSCCDGEPAVLDKLGHLFTPEVQGIAVCDRGFGTLLSYGVKKLADAAPTAGTFESWTAPIGTIDRRRLRSMLAESLLQDRPATASCAGIFYNKHFDSNELLSGGRVRIRFTDGSTADADLLIGADGARSLVRQLRAPRLRLEPVGVMNLAGYVPFDACSATAFPAIRAAVFGDGRRPPYLARACSPAGVSVLAISFRDTDGGMNLLVAVTFEAPGRDTDAYMRTEGLIDVERPVFRERVRALCRAKVAQAGFAPEVVELVGSMPAANVLDGFRVDLQQVAPTGGDPLADGDPRAFGRVTLIGDSLHAMTPQRGLGANTALMDATDLTDCILATVAEPGGDSANAVSKAVSSVEGKIVARGFANVRASAQSTYMFCSKGWAAVARSAVLRFMSVAAWVTGY
ncbi:hypothetical protein DFJ73DRAFT_760498 [Zopfochytrium polystomum]|nr:hypothetical protein DFJ73DRAFT_760498 [Zopfochytrium polystomum]